MAMSGGLSRWLARALAFAAIFRSWSVRADKAEVLARVKKIQPLFEECELKNDIEIAYLVDSSSSMVDVNNKLRELLPNYLRELRKWNPNIKASVSQFCDRPPEEYCTKTSGCFTLYNTPYGTRSSNGKLH